MPYVILMFLPYQLIQTSFITSHSKISFVCFLTYVVQNLMKNMVDGLDLKVDRLIFGQFENFG